MPLDDLDELDQINWGDQDLNDPKVQIRILAGRVTRLTREKEELEKQSRDHLERIEKMEKAFTMGRGALLVVPIVGTFIAFLFAYGRTIFKPWTIGP